MSHEPDYDNPPIRVLGLGSDNGVDQLGFLAAQRLATGGFATHYPEYPVDISICPSPALLAARYLPARALILIDAWHCEQPAGTVRRISLDEIASVQRPTSSHGLDLRQALELCLSLEEEILPVPVIGISTGAGQYETRAPLDILETCFPALQDIIDQQIRELLRPVS